MIPSTLRTLIVDDEPAARQRLRDLLAGATETEVVAEAADVPGALALVRAERPDVVFLDIEMPGADGFALLDELAHSERPAVVFVTAHEEHALRAFDVEAIDYLLKPFGWDRLESTLARVRDEVAHRRQKVLSSTVEDLLADYRRPRSVDDRLPIRQNGRVSFLRIADIDWVDAAHNQVRIHAHGVSHLLRESISALEERLDGETFLRVHRSTIVNVNRIQELLVNPAGQYVLVLRSGQRLSVSRSYRERLRDALKLED